MNSVDVYLLLTVAVGAIVGCLVGLWVGDDGPVHDPNVFVSVEAKVPPVATALLSYFTVYEPEP